MNRRKLFFANFLVFTNICKVRKIESPRSPHLGGQANFTSDRDIFIFLNYCYWVCKRTKYLFSPDYSFKICAKFFESVHVALLCLHNRWLHQHLSARSTTTPILYQRSQRLCGHAIFKNVELQFLLLFSLVFYFFPKKNNFQCVSVVVDYAGTVSA